MSCETIPSISDLEKTKLRVDHFGEIIDGTPSGTSINPITGQVLIDLPTTLKNAGFKPASFTFVTGGVLTETDYDKAVYNPTPNGDNNWYIWGGTTPKTIPANSTPQTTGGFGTSAWIQKTDIVLKPITLDSLRRTYSESGYTLVPGSFQSGGIVNSATDVLLNETNGWAWAWDGPFPKEVPSGSIPGAGWTSRADGVDPSYIKNAVDISSRPYAVGQLITCASYRNDDKALHDRVVSSTDDGSGIITYNGMFANLVVEDRIIKASTLGWASGEDRTASIAALATKVKTDKVLYLQLDTGDITTTDILPFEFGATMFSGKGRLLCTKIDNMLQRLPVNVEQRKQYHGPFNSGALFTQGFKNAVLMKKEVRIVLFGDSISVGPDYDSNNTIAAGYNNTTGVDNADRHDALGVQIFTELVACLPRGCRIKFYNRSIGGKHYGDCDRAWDTMGGLFTDREQATPGKTWRDCVIDLNPDIVIHSMGMNESPASYVNNFQTKWMNYLSTLQRYYSFDQVLLTTPNPNFNNAESFGDFRLYAQNASKLYVAALQRYMATRWDLSLIDSALSSYIKRYGIDPRNCTFSKTAMPAIFPNETNGMVIPPGSGETTTTCTPRDLPIYSSTTLTINPSVASNTAGFDFKLNIGSVILQFTTGSVKIYTGVHNGAVSILGTLVVSAPLVMAASTNYTFTLTVTPSGVFLYYNNTLLLHNNDAAYIATLPIWFDNPPSSANVTVSNMSIRGPEFAKYTPDVITNGEMYGNITSTQNEFGGGINHPSTVGISEVYLPPVREFIGAGLNASTTFSSTIGGTTANEAVFIGRIMPIDYGRSTFVIAGPSAAGQTVTIESRVIGGVVSYNVKKNTGEVAVYIDIVDMSVFLKNTTAQLLHIDYTGNWYKNKIQKLGVVTPRGALLPTVP